jgi:Flp pilus assembly protein TadG
MNGYRSSLVGDQRGVAAVEFALIAPVLLLLLGGVTDFGLVMFGKSQLANGVAQGIQYALLQGPSVSAAAVSTMVVNGSSRSGLAATVTVTITGPACYCVSGTPAALVSSSPPLSASYTCTGTCPSPEMAPGVFLTIAASFVYQPLTPFYRQLANATVHETVTARLK